jgi:hypothetical protein
MMLATQPEDQLTLEGFAVFDAELCAALRPPFRNATVANQFAGIEESAGIGTAKELLAPGAGDDAQQAQGVLQPIEVDFVAGHDLLYA